MLLDINLPDDAGWALLRGDAFAAAGSPPVVVVTATTLSPRRLREYGVAGCLPKPFAMETLRSTIDRLMPPEDTPLNLLELLTGAVAAFTFVYLVWALLRPEDI